MVYFDNAASTAPLESVCETVNYVNKELYANSSASHGFGLESEKLIDKSRKLMGDILGVKYDTIFFTSGGTEANNLAVLGYLKANKHAGKHIITSKTEHPAVLEIFKFLASEGYEVTTIEVDEKGRLDYEGLYEAIRSDTSLISIMTVNNETGAIHDLVKIASIRNEKNIKAVIHSDCVQAFGKIALSPLKSGIDMLSASGHKFHAPKGIGVLYARKGIRLLPVIYGGGHEKGLRSGTLNTPGIAGLYPAAQFMINNLNENSRHVKSIKDTIISRLSEGLENICDKFIVNGDAEKDSPYILNFSLPGIKSEVMLHHLAQRKIYVSAGSACASNNKKYSHVLSSMMLGADVIDSSLRFSFSHNNTKEEAVIAADAIIELVRTML